MNSGSKPLPKDAKDFDLFQTFGIAVPPTFPATYSTDAGFPIPNQDAPDTQFTPPTLPMENGCTDFAQVSLATDIDGILRNPDILEAVTHANALGGIDIRTSFKGAVSIGLFANYFNITHPTLSPSDSFRLAQLSGIPEKRSVSWGCPWMPSWETAARNGQVEMDMPTQAEIQQAVNEPNTLPWHDSKLFSWLEVAGTLVYCNASWQGTSIGDNGVLHFPVPVIDAVMAIPGTCGFTGTRMGLPGPAQPIASNFWEILEDDLKTLLGIAY